MEENLFFEVIHRDKKFSAFIYSYKNDFIMEINYSPTRWTRWNGVSLPGTT